MPDPTMDAVLSRLDALEKQNRRLKRWGASILMLGLALGGMAMAQEEKVPEVIRAKRFEVVDNEGQSRASLGVMEVQFSSGGILEPTPDIYGILTLSSKNGREVAHYGSDGVQLVLNDSPRSASLSAEGLEFTKDVGVPATKFFARGVFILDKDGKTLFKVPE